MHLNWIVFIGSITPSIDCLWLLSGPPELQVYLLQLLQADGILNQLRKVTPTSIMFEQSTLYLSFPSQYNLGVGVSHPSGVMSSVSWAPEQWQSWCVHSGCRPSKLHPCWGREMCFKTESSTKTFQPTLSEPGWWFLDSFCLRMG